MSFEPANRAPRLPVHAWARLAAAGALDGLAWVDARIDPEGPVLRETRGEDGAITFAHLPYAAFLPPPMVRAAAQAQAEGRATLLEALQLLFARAEWLVAGRHLLWSPLSPAPEVLAALVEAFGVEPELHGGRPDALARIASLLPSWRPYRGSVRHARALLLAACGEDIDVRGAADVADATQIEDEPTDEVTHAGGDTAEIFACRSAGWLATRTSGATGMRVQGGFLVIAGLSRDRAEDAFVALPEAARAVRPFSRLLPTWCTLRILPAGDRDV